MTHEEVRIEPCDPVGRFRDEGGNVGEHPATLAGHAASVDERAVASVMLFGAIVPPLSPFKGVARLLPGSSYIGSSEVRQTPLPTVKVPETRDPETQWRFLSPHLDGVLTRILSKSDDPIVLLFSGGVDSALLGARLAALGQRDVIAVNYCFGRDDPEAALAEAMAKKLGLAYERVTALKEPPSVLEAPGAVYPMPFGDQSVVPTSRLADAVISMGFPPGTRIVDGIGADGCFGLGPRLSQWSALYRVPSVIRRGMARLYGPMWFRSGPIERALRIAARSAHLPLEAAIVAQSPLVGSRFSRTNETAFRRLSSLLADWLARWSGVTGKGQAVAADLALTCANVYAQKSDPILRGAKYQVVHPFLDPQIVAIAIESAETWQMETPKAPLKWALGTHVHESLVYRAKSGFVDPMRGPFADPALTQALSDAAEDGPVARVLSGDRLIEAREHLARGSDLPPQTLNLLWSAAFCDRWYRTARPQVEASL